MTRCPWGLIIRGGRKFENLGGCFNTSAFDGTGFASISVIFFLFLGAFKPLSPCQVLPALSILGHCRHFSAKLFNVFYLLLCVRVSLDMGFLKWHGWSKSS